MADRKLARFVAPMALLAAVVGIMVVVQVSRSDNGAPSQAHRATTTHTARPAKPKARAYVVKPGDNLTVIASKTGVDVDTLQQLNPGIDPQALRVGQRLTLVP
jgi:LysM repeat protein